jgi:CheY-like chemotaxis protein
MDQETQKKIFEPFFTTKGEGKGTGLGLSTVFGIVKQANGYIWIYSELGRGTTFKIYLPAADGSTRPVVAKAEPPIETCRGGETILIVEDEDLVRDFARNTLAEFGYSAIAAVTSTDAVEIIRSTGSTVDLVLTDVVMPMVGGPAIGEILESSSPGTKIIYMSGYTGNGVASQGMLEKENDFLAKPFSREQLVRKVREVLDRRAPPEYQFHRLPPKIGAGAVAGQVHKDRIGKIS